MTSTRIFLIGFMGAGKSTYGRQLAEELGWSFADTDSWIEEEAGQTIAEIFATEGETTFRQWESKALEAMLLKSEVVIATGGGLPVNPAHQELMRSGGLVIWLNTTWEQILERLRTMQDRPLVDRSNPGWKDHLKRLYDTRLAAYRCAHLIIDPEQSIPEALTRRLFKD